MRLWQHLRTSFNRRVSRSQPAGQPLPQLGCKHFMRHWKDLWTSLARQARESLCDFVAIQSYRFVKKHENDPDKGLIWGGDDIPDTSMLSRAESHWDLSDGMFVPHNPALEPDSKVPLEKLPWNHYGPLCVWLKRMLKIVRQSGLAANMTSYYLDIPFATPVSRGHGKEHMPTSIRTVYFTRAGQVY